MQHNSHPSNNENPILSSLLTNDNDNLIVSSLLADDNELPPLPPDPLEPLIKKTIKELLAPAPDYKTLDTSSHNTNPPSTSTNPDSPTPSSAQPDEELFKARSRHSQEFSDLANARRFVSQHRDHLRYIPQSNCWMLWDGQRWSPDTHNNILTFAHATIQSFHDEALALPCEQRQRSEQLFNHADRSDTPKRLQTMLNLASLDPTLIASPHTFDSDPLLLNVLNGTINLRTAQLQPHDPHDFITRLTPVIYDPSANSPVWDKFLSEITHHDPKLQHFLQSAVGYSLTGSIQEQVIFLIQGLGGNGKSTFLNAISFILGDYAQRTTCDIVTSKSNHTSSTPLHPSFRDARLVIVLSSTSDRTLNSLSVEYITDGENITTARTPHLAHLSSPHYPPNHFKLWMATNELPTVRNHSAGTWRRIKLIHFPVSFKGREDKNLATKLQGAAPAILNWAIQGCLTWQRQGLLAPECVQLTTSGYQDEQDQLASFLHDCCQLGPQHSIKASTLYALYQAWCQVTGKNNPLDTKAFSLQIFAHGYLRVHKKAGNFYLGLNAIVPIPPTNFPDNAGGEGR